MHPFFRTLIAAMVLLLLAAGAVALGLISGDPGLSIWAILGSAAVASLVGLFVFARAWAWATREARANRHGKAVGIALAGGLMFVLAAGSLAVALVMALLFVIG